MPPAGDDFEGALGVVLAADLGEVDGVLPGLHNLSLFAMLPYNPIQARSTRAQEPRRL